MSELSRFRKSSEGLFEDPEFPASQSSVFYHQTPPFVFQWKRPKDIVPNPTFIKDDAYQFDITPGKLGDRWLVSCIGSLHLTKGLFYRVVPADQGFYDNYIGAFRFRVWWCGEWREVLIDDRLPTVQGKLVFLHCESSCQFWPSLLEKAYAKLHGSYEALKYGSTIDALSDFTGGIAESLSLKSDPTMCGRLLNKLIDLSSIVTAVVNSPSSTPSNKFITNNNGKVFSERLASGIVIGVNYRIYAIEKIEKFSGEEVTLVRLRSPLGASLEYVGAWGGKSAPEWNEIPNNEMDRLNLKYLADGEFWMSYSDFIKTFTQLELVHLDGETAKDEPSLRNKMAWNSRVYQGAWQKGVSAGGCRNNTDTFHINPQLHLILSEMEEVIVSLNQHSVMEPKVIGFTAYPVSKNAFDSIGKSYFKKHKSLVNSQYTNSRQVCERAQLEHGGYILLPTTFEPGQESSFTLRVFSSKPLKLKLKDVTPCLIKPALIQARGSMEAKSLRQYEAVFLQVADEHRSVNAFELHELLEACLPNDYIKSCASLDICRQVILGFDTTGTGRLKFSDFKDLMVSLKFWQSSFKSHTKERTGILKAERLRDALEDVGFRLSTDVVSTLVLRYMRKDGTLRFGDFVSSVLHLSMAFNIFEKKDPLQNGSIKMTMSDWLKAAMLC